MRWKVRRTLIVCARSEREEGREERREEGRDCEKKKAKATHLEPQSTSMVLDRTLRRDALLPGGDRERHAVIAKVAGSREREGRRRKGFGSQHLKIWTGSSSCHLYSYFPPLVPSSCPPSPIRISSAPNHVAIARAVEDVPKTLLPHLV